MTDGALPRAEMYLPPRRAGIFDFGACVSARSGGGELVCGYALKGHDNRARGDVPYGSLGGWLGVDAIQQACASRFPALSATAPRLFGRSLSESRSPHLLYKAW